MTTDLERMMDADAVDPGTPDRLQSIRSAIVRRRDLDAELRDAEDRVRALKRERDDIDYRTLPEIMIDAGVVRVEVPSDGNMPAVQAILSDYYRASIPAEWPVERRRAAFNRLHSLGLDDIVKREVKVTFPIGDEQACREACQALDAIGVPYTVAESAHHMTLTSALRELCEAGQQPSPEALEDINGYVGKVVRVKEA